MRGMCTPGIWGHRWMLAPRRRLASPIAGSLGHAPIVEASSIVGTTLRGAFGVAASRERAVPCRA